MIDILNNFLIFFIVGRCKTSLRKHLYKSIITPFFILLVEIVFLEFSSNSGSITRFLYIEYELIEVYGILSINTTKIKDSNQRLSLNMLSISYFLLLNFFTYCFFVLERYPLINERTSVSSSYSPSRNYSRKLLLISLRHLADVPIFLRYASSFPLV